MGMKHSKEKHRRNHNARDNQQQQQQRGTKAGHKNNKHQQQRDHRGQEDPIPERATIGTSSTETNGSHLNSQPQRRSEAPPISKGPSNSASTPAPPSNSTTAPPPPPPPSAPSSQSTSNRPPEQTDAVTNNKTDKKEEEEAEEDAGEISSPSDSPSESSQPNASSASAMEEANNRLIEDYSKLEAETKFTQIEIAAIKDHVIRLLALDPKTPYTEISLNKAHFMKFAGTTSRSLFIERLFAIFDISGKGEISFPDLLHGLGPLSQKATREEKQEFSFKLLDSDQSGTINREITRVLLRSCLHECKDIKIPLSDNQIMQLVDATFNEADLDKNGVVDFKEYQTFDETHPGMFDFLTVDTFGVMSHIERQRSLGMTV